jgi:hypothetical protein
MLVRGADPYEIIDYLCQMIKQEHLNNIFIAILDQ